MIQLADKTHCTGCSACMNVCRQNAISMQADNEGFMQPAIDVSKCVECHLCEKHCPALFPINTGIKVQTAYAIINNEDRNVSSSGGAFSFFARKILEEGGVVFGAYMSNDHNLKHIPIFDIDGLDKLRGSKYVQSDIEYSFRQIRTFLTEGRKVLFCGTPCQVSGLYKYLNDRYNDQLITLDLVCHGVPSQLVFKVYLEKLKKCFKTNDDIKEFRFRKLNSWDYCPAIKFSESEWKILDREKNVYMDAFFNGWIYRESCFHCAYANMDRVGTFTIADFWGIGKHGLPFKKNVASGVSLVIDNHNNMYKFITDIKTNVYIEKRPLNEALYENHNLSAPVERKDQRNTAIVDMLSSDVSLFDFATKYGLLEPQNLFTMMKKLVKKIIYALGLYNVYKSIIYKMK